MRDLGLKLTAGLFTLAFVAGCSCGAKPVTCDADQVVMNGTCVTKSCATGTGTVGEQCATQHRSCNAASMTCGSCVTGYMDFAGSCEKPVSCSALDCSATHQACVDTPNGHCGDCEQGYAHDGGTDPCHLALTCADITCPSGKSCTEPSSGDAYCADGCGTMAIGDDAGVCHGCPACSDSANGEDGPWLQGLSGEGRCICQTAPGFFWEEGQFPGVKPCDGDGDGWVRESAKLAIESSSTAVSTNARCTLRQINTVLLENDRGEQHTVAMAAAASLYETDRNDDAVALTQAESLGKLPATYGDGGRALTPAELNSFTKLCVDTQSDFNENGLADVNEWQTNPDLTAVKATFKPFAPFLYFGELERGWYEPAPDGGPIGIWHIKERSRLATAPPGDQVGFVEPSDAGDYWRQCDRQQDQAYAGVVTTGASQQNYDFARFGADDAGWSGMNQSSQFKCVVAVTQKQPSDPSNFYTVPDLLAQGLSMNACVSLGSPEGPPPQAPVINPSSTPFTCSPLDFASLINGQAGWAVAGYLPYGTPGGYVRGCVNECTEYPYRCPGYDPTVSINPSTCGTEQGDYGKLTCTCDPRFSGAECDFGCPGDPTQPLVAMSNLFVDPAFLLPDGGLGASLIGYWMCGKPAETSYSDPAAPYLGDTLGDPDSGYSLVGEIPVVRATGGALCEGDCDGGGYAIR